MAYQAGQRPRGPANDPQLLVVGMDGGRVQSRQKQVGKDGQSSRWRENKVLTITTYRLKKQAPTFASPPGPDDASAGSYREPQRLVTTYLATMSDSLAFGVQARLEAERGGVRQAHQVVVIGDGAAWIDTLHQEHFARHPRIVDWYHAKEHLMTR